MITVTINITIGHSKKVLPELKPGFPWSVFLRWRWKSGIVGALSES